MNHAYVREVCRFFFPDNVPANITPEIEDVAAGMLYTAMEKSKVLDLVPRPSGTLPGRAWLVDQAVMLFWRTQRSERIYETTRKAAAYQWRVKYEMALQGL